MRESFRRAREQRNRKIAPKSPVRHILVAFGGSDPANRTGLALNAIAQSAADIRTTVILGQGAPHLDAVRQQISALPNVTLQVDPEQMAEAMLACDLALGGAGTSAWERCCLGLPALVVVAADNQREWADRLATLGVARVVE
ncbi:glycosyltransferase, partial [Elstera litoralis]|uniref:glycosyltransferase n=1 Tax=Elstera litoralis TaxID=552518 RepID=UPI0022B6468B